MITVVHCSVLQGSLITIKMEPTTRSRLYSALVISTIIVSQMTSLIDAGAILTVRLVSYKNPNSRDYYNQACDVVFNTRCDNLFDFCIDAVGGNNNFGNGDCRYGVFRTGEFANNDDVRFQRDMYGVANPLVVRIDQWQNIRFKVRVRDDDSSHSSHDLVDRFYRVWEAVPGVNNTNYPPTSSVVITGQRTSTQKTSLTVQFSVKCEAHYYGRDCATYCRYSDDSSGHYRCTSTGNKECLNGWEDVPSACTIRSDDCLQNTCENGAVCVDGHRSYTCQCPRGYTGTNCEIEINECESGPCQNNGTCVNEVGSYSCQCPDAYPATLSPVCGIHTCLFNNPCKNGGTCYGAGLCACMPNYVGSKCEMHQCQKNCITCYNGGVCTGTSCDCPKGTLGERCDVQVCDIIECLNGGTCTEGTCICAIGFTGKFCHENVNDCLNAPCQNGGFCVDGVANYSCRCQYGYSGDNCQIVPTTTTPEPTTTSTPPETTTKRKKPNGPNGLDYLSDKDPQAVRATDKPDNMFLVMIILLVALLIIIIVLIAMLCKARINRKLKEARAEGRSETAANSNFENPVYTMDRARVQPNHYDDGYLTPQAMGGGGGGGMENGGFTNKVYGGPDMESSYAQPPRGPARPVHHNGGEPIYDQPRDLGGMHAQPPPYSPGGGAYSRSIDSGAVSMNDIKARVEAEPTYEELNSKVPLP